MSGGSDQTLLLFKADKIEENRANVETILNLLGFPLKFDEDVELKLVADFKLLSYIVGLQHVSSRHCCPYCQVCNLLICTENISI